MSKRQIGKCEAVYRVIPALRLQDSNIGCTFVQSGYPENQSKFLKRVYKTNNQKEQSADDLSSESDSKSDSNDHNDQQKYEEDEKIDQQHSELYKVAGRQGLFQQSTSIHEKYAARPEGVNDLTLSQFATSYTKVWVMKNN